MSAPFSYENLPVFDSFADVNRPGTYVPLPDDWIIGVTDVVRSTDAIGAGRYKAVNMAGASIVSAVTNALGHAPFPFVFGGDGAVVAVGPEHRLLLHDAMARTIRFVEEELSLTLRAGSLAVIDIRRAGHDVRVARYAASPEAIYAMFSGGGASYAAEELKAGRIAVPAAAAGERPDLSGLSCRWAPIEAQHGVMLSVLVSPAQGAEPTAFRAIATQVLALLEREERGSNPVPPDGPEFTIKPSALRLEGRATAAPAENTWARTAKIAGEMLLAIGLDRLGRSLGRFDPRRYRAWVARNTDFRKYEDGLRMTVDCSEATAGRLETLLAAAEARRIVDYGLHRQSAALMTCIVPSPLRNDHMHFLDGAGGGYAQSAADLKARLAARVPAAA